MKMKITFLFTTLMFLFATLDSSAQEEDKISGLTESSAPQAQNNPYWRTNGNSGTSQNVHFIGTTDNQDLVFKRNNSFSGKIGFFNTSYGFKVGQGGSYNVFIGRRAGSDSSNSNNINNVSIGENSGRSNISGAANTFVGYSSGYNNTTGYGNTFIGSESGRVNSVGYANTGLGYHTLFNNTTGINNVGLSNSSLELNQTGNNNVALGVWALHKNISGNENIGIGHAAGQLSTGNSNIFIGESAGSVLASGNKNMFLGYSTGHFLTSGSNNIFIGPQAGYSTNSGSDNLFLGMSSGINSGSKNIVIGKSSGGNSGNGNIIFGNNAVLNPSFQSNLLTNNILNIGNVIFGYNMNRLSSTDNATPKSGKIGINKTTPNTALEINSEIKDNSGLRFTNLTSSYNPPLASTNTKFLSVNATGDVVLQYMANNSITNLLSSNANTMTSTVNGMPVSASIVNSIFNTFNNNNQLITTVNGVASAPVNLPLPTFTEVDGSITNELQNLSLSGNTLSISSGNSIVLPSTLVTAGPNVTVTGNGSSATPYVVSATNTDAQSLSLVGNNLTISNGNTVVLPIPTFTEVDGSTTNELQTLSQAGNVVTLSNNGGSFTLPMDTDQQSLSLVGNNLSISNGNTVVLPTFTEVDGSITNELQNLSLSGNTLSISSGNSIVLPSTLVTAGPNVTVTGNGSSVTPYVVSATNTDAQSLTLVGNNLTISNGNTVVLPIPTFTEVDGSVTNELQTLSQAGNVVTLSNGGGSFTLPTTSVIAGTNVTVTGNGSTATPFQINAVDTSLYANNGSINQATTTGVNRVVDMNNRNIWFNTTNSTSNGKIYLGSTSVYPTTTGNYKLFVEGGILTEKVKVALRSTSNWADYVFADDYKLMSLKELEQYVVSNKHLPGIDSASELSKNGLDLGEMQSKQMEKIEELTLYVIEQNKTLESQSRILENQNKEIEELKSQMKALIEKTK